MHTQESQPKRDLLAPTNLGEFAFSLCVCGIGFLILAGVVAGMILALLRNYIPENWQLLALWVLMLSLWILFQAPIFLKLRDHAKLWKAVVKEDRQMHYLEWAMVCFCFVFSFFVEFFMGETGAYVMRGMQYIFASMMLALIAYHIVTYALFRVRPERRQWLTWGAMVGVSVVVFFHTN